MVQEMGDGPDRPFPEDRAPAPHAGLTDGIRDRRRYSGASPCDWVYYRFSDDQKIIYNKINGFITAKALLLAIL